MIFFRDRAAFSSVQYSSVQERASELTRGEHDVPVPMGQAIPQERGHATKNAVVEDVDHRDRGPDVPEPQGAASNCRKRRPLQRKAEGKPKGLQMRSPKRLLMRSPRGVAEVVPEGVVDEVSEEGLRGLSRGCR